MQRKTKERINSHSLLSTSFLGGLSNGSEESVSIKSVPPQGWTSIQILETGVPIMGREQAIEKSVSGKHDTPPKLDLGPYSLEAGVSENLKT